VHGVSLTPLPDLKKVQDMTDLLTDAQVHGAKILNRRGGACAGTLFYPAVVYPVTSAMRLYREEQFGPVVPNIPFKDVETALGYVVTSDHGQQVSIFTRSPAEVGRLVDPLVNQVCRVNINSQCQREPDVFPFTGRKNSAEGTLSVTDALRSFSIRSMIAAKETEASKALLRDVVQQRRSKFISTDFLF
jgi:glyceraldehyde-3-phosphate dehydrogenase (NADP+)